jgi:Rrf2 family cysteine metabolism transcriptional repressor
MSMQLSTKSKYGVRAMIEIARLGKSGPVKRKDISRAQKISHAYLENILITLKSSRLIRTVRGAKGGFALDMPASAITLFRIVTVLEGTLSPVECLESASICEKTGACAARIAWAKLYAAQKKVLEEITLQDLEDWESTDGAPDYAI